MQQFLDRILEAIRAAGLADAIVLSCTHEEHLGGLERATIQQGNVVVEVVWERAEDLVKVGSTYTPHEMWQMLDIEVALGWASPSDALKRAPYSLDSVLATMAMRFGALNDALSSERARTTNCDIGRVARVRGEAFLQRLSALASGSDTH